MLRASPCSRTWRRRSPDRLRRALYAREPAAVFSRPQEESPMDLTFGKEELAFQQEVRDWLKENLTPEMQGELKVSRNAYLPKEKLIDWQKRLAKKGWLCTGWPKEFGGPGFTTTQKYIFEMEMARVGAPGTSPFGPRMCAPVIMKYGSEEQKKRYLPAMLNSDVIWCQGYSEPGSGSDLASLKTRAVREGDFY